ncbi:hypothetical protein D3C81_2082440 [compost metagenome]
MFSVWLAGIERMATEKLTTYVSPAATVSRGMPVSGLTPGLGKPLIMTLLGTNCVSGARASNRVTCAG